MRWEQAELEGSRTDIGAVLHLGLVGGEQDPRIAKVCQVDFVIAHTHDIFLNDDATHERFLLLHEDLFAALRP